MLDNVGAAYEKLARKVRELKEEGTVDAQKIEAFRAKFEAALCNDLNTSMAITVIYDVLREDMNDKTKKEIIKSFEEVLSIGLFNEIDIKESAVDEELLSFIQQMIQDRNAAKKEKDYEKADEIRQKLAARGVIIKDTREGTTWEIE